MLRAYFSYVPLGLSVRFLDLSSGNPVSYLWAFEIPITLTTPGTGGQVVITPQIDSVWANMSLLGIADSNGSLGGTYLLLSSTSDDYYVWFDTGGSTDPQLSGRTGIKVDITPNSTGVDVASAIGLALDSMGIFQTSQGTVPEELLIVLVDDGPVNLPNPGNSGIDIALIIQGVDFVPAVMGPDPGTVTPNILTSTDKEPIITFPAAGVYSVTLTVTDYLGDTSSITLPVGASDYLGHPALPTLIIDAVLSRLPQSLLPTIPVIDGYIKKWQLYLAILIDPNIQSADTFDETKWPALVNDLIINLILYDIITDRILSGGAAAAFGTGNGGGGLKKVVTGPAEAEWFGASDAIAAIMRGGGLYDQLRNRICTLSKRLRIPLEFCSDIAWQPRAPQIIKDPQKRLGRRVPSRG